MRKALTLGRAGGTVAAYLTKPVSLVTPLPVPTKQAKSEFISHISKAALNSRDMPAFDTMLYQSVDGCVGVGVQVALPACLRLTLSFLLHARRYQEKKWRTIEGSETNVCAA